ncbi:MAG: peptidase M4 family protein, partial [Candidatus Zixiibacteriota bacterium]
MKVHAILFGLILLAFGPSMAKQQDDGFVGANLLRENPDISTYRDNDNGIPQYVEGRLWDKTARGNETAAVYSYFEKHRAAYRMSNPAEELRVVRLDEDGIGMRHVRIQQYHRGVKVIGGELIAHFSSDGMLKTVNGDYHARIDLDVTPSLPSGEALGLALSDLESFFGTGVPTDAELVVFPWEGSNYLCWRFFLNSDRPAGRWEYFVDAGTGDIVYKANRIMEEDVWGSGIGVMGDPRNYLDIYYEGGTYYMIDYTRQINNNVHGHRGYMPDGNYIQTNIAGATLPGSVATDADNIWDDPNVQAPAVDGHTYTGLVYDWLVLELDRNGYDDAGASMLTIVNYSGEGDNNAYWDGSRIVVWSWSTGWRSLAGSPDVIAHEWGHAVTEYTSGLVYEKEPGALNESFSDQMGAAFEWAHDSLDVPDWDVGENGRLTGEGFRSMSDPHSAGDPDYYGTSDPYWIDVVNCTPSYYNDYCGVHTNSGVGNKWFYLLSEGGTHHDITVTGIGVENAIKISYQANAFYWTSLTDYHNAALGTISAAGDLNPSGAWAIQVANAWNAVGVSTPGPSLVFDYPGGVPEVVTPNQPETFTVEVTGLLGGIPEPNSGMLHYSIDNGPYDSTAMSETSPGVYDATLPAINCNVKIAFYVAVDEESGTTFYDPDPGQPNTAIAATQINIVLQDDFETDQGWTVTGDALDGQWNRGIPAGGGDRGDPPTDYDGSGSCYLTDNEDGNSDVDDGTTNLISPVFDVQNSEARVSYARWYSNNY